jgi:acyl-CoA synthetase (NDP forming)
LFLKKEKDVELVKKVGFPCVMKVIGKEIMHKTEVSGIIKNVQTPEQALEAFNNLMKIKELAAK